ncbi:cell division protein FtsQ [Pusillimonas sp.]|uniref:alginate O-acetyltransferase AlgX-related protein n=1 Tax=Burkholderiales TaxID=80840 RepID=UPI0037CC447E
MALADPVQSFNQPSRVARAVAGCAFIAAMLAGAASIVWSMAAGRISLASDAWTRSSIMSGETARGLAAELARTPLPVALADAERAASWLVAGSLGPRVRRGCDPWLFLNDELAVHLDAGRNAQERLAAVALVRELLRRRGAELVVATVPDKSRVQHEQLCGLYRPVSSADRLSQWEAGLARHGIPQAALLPALDEVKRGGEAQPFLTIDTHWTEAGARAAADALARVVRQAGLALTPHQQYRLEPGEPRDRQGDLLRLAGVDWLPASLLPPPDRVATVRLSPLAPDQQGASPHSDDASASAAAGDAADDLFGDASLPTVALIGTSYSRTSSFVPFLEAALSTPVPSFAQDGGDFWGAAKTYLASAEFRETPPRLVIWEMPERVLQMPLAPEEKAWMQGLKAPARNDRTID